MKENSVLHQKSYSFALEVIELYKSCLKENYHFNDLFKQFMRSGTSVGANIYESTGAISTAEFSSKISIAYKEAVETRYWLMVLKDSNLINQTHFENLDKKADELCRIMFSILKNTGRIKPKQIDKT